jgi:hypothetical protein
MLSGGSFASLSLIPAANTVTVQASLGARSTFGSSVNVVPELAPRSPLTTVFAGVRIPLVHAIWNQLPDTVTGSLNTSVTLLPALTPVALAAGIVDTTEGATSTGGGSD